MKIVLAGCGFIGHNIVRKLMETYDDISIINQSEILPDRYAMFSKNPTKVFLARTEWFNHTIEDVDVLIYFASITDAKLGPTRLHTISHDMLIGTKNILKRIKPKHFIYASSSMVYGEFNNKSPNEETLKNPIEPYGMLKSISEDTVKYYCNEYGIDYTIVRPSAVYGPRATYRNVIDLFMLNAVADKPLVLHGNHYLDFTYVDDLADGVIKMINNKNAIDETFNMTMGQARSLVETAEIVIDVIGKGTYVLEDHNELYPVRGALDISKAKKLLGYDPVYTLEKGIQEYVEYFNKMGHL